VLDWDVDVAWAWHPSGRAFDEFVCRLIVFYLLRGIVLEQFTTPFA